MDNSFKKIIIDGNPAMFDGQNVVFLSEQDMEEIKDVLSPYNLEFNQEQALSFFIENINLYYYGKQAGFIDTEVSNIMIDTLSEKHRQIKIIWIE